MNGLSTFVMIEVCSLCAILFNSHLVQSVFAISNILTQVGNLKYRKVITFQFQNNKFTIAQNTLREFAKNNLCFLFFTNIKK